MLLFLCIGIGTNAQYTSDSTDVFFRHLTLNEVIVTGLTGNTKLKHAVAPVSILTNKDLHAISSTNIIDAIAKQPGVSQLTTGSGISKPIIRGLGYNRILVLNDGIRQEGQQWGDEHGIEIDPQSINSVEILKGPASLMYGSDAMAGVLIFHRAPFLPQGKMKANISSEYQTNNGLFDYSVNFEGNRSGVVWNVRYSDKRAHAYKNKYDGYVPNSQFAERAASALLGLNKHWGHSHLTLGYYHLTPSIIEGERDPETGELESEVDNIKTYHHGMPYQQVYHYKTVWDNSINLHSGQLKVLLGYQQNRRQEFEESPDEYGLYFQLHTVNYDLRYLTSSISGWKFAIGANGMYQRSLNKGDEYLIPAYRLFDIGTYATVSKTWDKWTLNGGLRYDRRNLHSEELIDEGVLRFHDFTRNFNGLTGSIGAVFNATERMNIRMNLSRGFRTPNMSELGSNGVHEGTIRYEIGNQELKAEYSLQADLGLDISSNYFSAQLAVFANKIDNFIYAHRINEVMEDGYLTYRFDAGDARLMGFEAGLDIHPIHRWHFENTFSYVNAVQLHQPRESKYLPFTPAPRWTSELKYEITHHGKVFNNTFVSLGIENNLKQDHYYMEGNTETMTPAYTLLNASAGTDLYFKGKKRAEVYLIGNNLTDKAYQNHLSRLKYTDINSKTGRQGIHNMGRNILLKVIIPLQLSGEK